MDPLTATESDVSSVNGDVLDMELGDNADGMSDEEVQLELNVLQQDRKKFKDPNKKTGNDTPLATPKIQSVVVIPESASNSPNVEVRRSSSNIAGKAETPKIPKRRRNRNCSGKNKANNSEGTLVALLSKVKMSGIKNVSEPADKQIKLIREGTPTSTKRVRSAGSTPEDCKKNPEKLAKLQGVGDRNAPIELSKSSLMERRTLNLKVCIAKRPPTTMDLQKIKKFLQYQIEQAVAHQAEFIPIFKEPCKIERDGVYVYCSDQKCAQWITYIAMTGIPEISTALLVLPHETPLTFEPEQIMVRVLACIPTKRPKHQILEFLATLNRDLDTEKWKIKKIRPKGSSSSMVYMRIDKRSFDIISARDNKVNWILGPIDMVLEEHGSRPKKSHPLTSADAIGNSESKDRHLIPLSVRNVDSVRRRTGLTCDEDGKPELKGVIVAGSDKEKYKRPYPKSKED